PTDAVVEGDRGIGPDGGDVGHGVLGQPAIGDQAFDDHVGVPFDGLEGAVDIDVTQESNQAAVVGGTTKGDLVVDLEVVGEDDAVGAGAPQGAVDAGGSAGAERPTVAHYDGATANVDAVGEAVGAAQREAAQAGLGHAHPIAIRT